MTRFPPVRLAPKLVAGFAMVALFAVFVGVAGLLGLHTTRGQLLTLTRDTIPGISALKDADGAVNAALRYSRGAILAPTGTHDYAVRAATARAVAWRSFQGYVTSSSPNPAARSLAVRVERDLRRWMALDATTVQLAVVNAPPHTAAARLSVGAEQQVARRVTADLGALAALEARDTAQETRINQATYDAIVAEVLGVGALAALLALILGLVFARAIARPVSAVQVAADHLATGAVADLARAMDALSAGNLDAARTGVAVVPLDLRAARGRDEVGAMARSFERMQQGVTRIAAGLNGAREGLRRARGDLLASNAELARQVSKSGAAEARLRAVVANAPLILSQFDRDGVFVLSEGQGLRALGRVSGALVGHSIFELYRDAPELAAPVRRALAGESFVAHEDIDALVFETHWAPLRDAQGMVTGALSVATDVTERARAQEELRHQALHDSLTGLPNRALLHERLASARPGPRALLRLDLDHVKEVTDTFGHAQGDVLLRQIAERLRRALRPSDLVTRVGDHAFAVLLPDGEAVEAVRVAERLRATVEEPLYVEGQALQVGASVGIALDPTHGTDGTLLLLHADVAMEAARRGRLGHTVYNPAQDQHSAERLALVGELRTAIAAGALTLHYQPQVDLTSGRVCGVEALVRWPHPDPERGLIPPDAFIPLAEQTGLIAPLTEWVLADAIRQSRVWRRAGLLLCVSVNLSMWNLHDPALPDRVAALLRAHGVPPAWLRLELTESALMSDTTRAMDVMARLARLGVRLAVDDFGSGYSSLAYLKTLPVDELKIDKGFVREMATDATDAAIVASTVALGHALGLRVVAEGIENRATWDRLVGMGCDVAQGYYLSRPLPADALAHWLRDSPWAVA